MLWRRHRDGWLSPSASDRSCASMRGDHVIASFLDSIATRQATTRCQSLDNDVNNTPLHPSTCVDVKLTRGARGAGLCPRCIPTSASSPPPSYARTHARSTRTSTHTHTHSHQPPGSVGTRPRAGWSPRARWGPIGGVGVAGGAMGQDTTWRDWLPHITTGAWVGGSSSGGTVSIVWDAT